MKHPHASRAIRTRRRLLTGIAASLAWLPARLGAAAWAWWWRLGVSAGDLTDLLITVIALLAAMLFAAVGILGAVAIGTCAGAWALRRPVAEQSSTTEPHP